MKRKRDTPEQIIRRLRTAQQLLNQGQTVADVSRALEVSTRPITVGRSGLTPYIGPGLLREGGYGHAAAPS
jgi:hypothetical protein